VRFGVAERAAERDFGAVSVRVGERVSDIGGPATRVCHTAGKEMAPDGLIA
jgi:hypothetical protein